MSFWNSITNGFMFNMFPNMGMFGCCMPSCGCFGDSEPYIPPINKSLLNSIFETTSVVSSNPRAMLPFLPNPVVTATPTINTPFTNGGVYTFSPPSYQFDNSGLYNMNYYNSMQMPFLGLTGMPYYNPGYAQLYDEFLKLAEKSKKKVSSEEKVKSDKKVASKEEVKTEKDNKKTKTVTETSDNKKTFPPSDDRYFSKMLAFTLKKEGGYVNHPSDKGGETNRGVTKATYDSYREKKGLPIQSVKYITDEEVREIYHNFYVASGADKISNPRLAMCVFDWAIHSGPNNPALKSALAQCNGDPDRLIQLKREFLSRLIEKDPSQKDFEKGWNNRMDAISEFIHNELPESLA